MTSADSGGQRRAVVVGTGLVGGSIGLALRARGWWVTGRDLDPERARLALELGAVDAIGADPTAEITFVATPVSAVARAAQEALAQSAGTVTDVGSVKAPIVTAVGDARFVGGHPMAGSEQEGVEGASADLFVGATWVLTPGVDTDPAAYTRVRSVVTSLGAEVVALSPDRHDDVVALVSHVPHLVAATLMVLAAQGAETHGSLMRLAAGGFRDMTRVAAGHPGIWPDICAENREAIVEAFDALVRALSGVRDLVASADRNGLLRVLEQARMARAHLPGGAPQPEELAELRVPVPDRPGVLAEVTTALGEAGFNIYDIEIAHSTEGDAGVLVILIDESARTAATAVLVERHFRPSGRPLAP